MSGFSGLYHPLQQARFFMNISDATNYRERHDRWNSSLSQEWLQECSNRLLDQGFSEYRIEKYIGAWDAVVSHAIHWVGYTMTPFDESQRLVKTAIEAADFDLEKFRLDHTTHPLLLNARRGWSD
jgi:hypothetical protein